MCVKKNGRFKPHSLTHFVPLFQWCGKGTGTILYIALMSLKMSLKIPRILLIPHCKFSRLQSGNALPFLEYHAVLFFHLH